MIKSVSISLLKLILVVISFCMITTCSAQGESDSTMVSNRDIINSAMEIRQLRDSVATLNKINIELQRQVSIFEQTDRLNQSVIVLKDKQLTIYDGIIHNLTAVYTRKWYESKWVMFSAGAAFTYISAKVGRELLGE